MITQVRCTNRLKFNTTIAEFGDYIIVFMQLTTRIITGIEGVRRITNAAKIDV